MKLCNILFALVLVYQVNAQDNRTTKLDSLMTRLARHDKAMGSLAISREGEVLYQKAFGYASEHLHSRVPANTSTAYRIGSVTKMFTSTMIFQLIEEKKLHHDTRLSDFFPAIANSKQITIAHLLNHKSGVHDFTHDIRYGQWMKEPMSLKKLSKIIASYSPDFEPGEKQEYSNSNYWLLGRIIEKITRESFEVVLKNKITSVLGLKHTYYGDKINPEKNEAASYDFDLTKGWSVEAETDMSIPHGAGAIVSTPVELNLFTEALFSGQLITQPYLDSMQSIKGDYGMGLIEFSFAGKKWIGHDGAIDKFESIVMYSPTDKLGVSFCANGVVYPLNDILRDVLDIYFERSGELPVFKPMQITPNDLEKFVGRYLCEELDLRVSVKRVDSTLSIQAEGQNAFIPYASANDQFRYDKAGIVLAFSPDKNDFILKQNGKNFLFEKKDSVVAGTILLEGLLIDSVTREPVSFANIGVQGKGIGTVSNEYGKFRLQLATDTAIHTLIVSMIGYKCLTLNIDSFIAQENKLISLRPEAKPLGEVIIHAKKLKREKLGNTPLISGILKGQFPGDYGAEVGIPISINGPVIIDQFNFFVVEGEEDSLKFRLNIYSIGRDGTPDKNILTKNIYFDSANKQGWKHVDLKPYNLQVNQNFFVTVQYVKGYPGYKYFSAGYAGIKAWTRDASESYWEVSPVSVAMNVVVKR